MNREIITPLAEKKHQAKCPHTLHLVLYVSPKKVAYVIRCADSQVIVRAQAGERQLGAPRFIELVPAKGFRAINPFTPAAAVDALEKE